MRPLGRCTIAKSKRGISRGIREEDRATREMLRDKLLQKGRSRGKLRVPPLRTS